MQQIFVTDEYGRILPSTNGETPSWIFNDLVGRYGWWTMSPSNNNQSKVWLVNADGSLSENYVFSLYDQAAMEAEDQYYIRPVVTLSKTAITKKQ